MGWDVCAKKDALFIAVLYCAGSSATQVPLVRSVHWLLVVAFFTAYFVEPEESSIHVLAGYIVLGLVLVRVLWGFVGSEHPRFADREKVPERTVFRSPVWTARRIQSAGESTREG